MDRFKEHILDEAIGNQLKKWLEVNKRAFVRELKQNAKVMRILNSALDGPPMLDSNKRFVKLKLVDMIKTITSLGLFAVPGSVVLFPILVRVFPDLLPSSFKKERDRISFEEPGQFDRLN